MQPKITTILILIAGIPILGKCGELASWWQKTPNGNEICKEKWNDNYVIGIKCKILEKESNQDGHMISNLKRWYFYKNFIIGELAEGGQKKYFIFDETNCQEQEILTQNGFRNRIEALNLRPKIWTRWYSSNWGVFLTSGDYGEGMIFMLVKLPLLILMEFVLAIFWS